MRKLHPETKEKGEYHFIETTIEAVEPCAVLLAILNPGKMAPDKYVNDEDD